MSRGILQLAATGKLRLQLEYRVLPTPLQSMGEEAILRKTVETTSRKQPYETTGCRPIWDGSNNLRGNK